MTRSMRSQLAQTLSFYLVVVLLLLTGQPPLSAKPKQPAWDVFAGQFIESYLKMHPPFAANAGRHEFNGRLPDWSPAGLSKQKQWLESEGQLAIQYPDSELKASERFEQQYLLGVIDTDLFWLKSAQAPYKNPLFYSQSLDPNLYVSRPYAPIEQRLRAFIEYARNIPKATEQIRTNLRTPIPRTYIDLGKTVFGGLAKFYQNDAKAAFATVTDPQLQKQFDAVVPRAAKSMQELANWLATNAATQPMILPWVPRVSRKCSRQLKVSICLWMSWKKPGVMIFNAISPHSRKNASTMPRMFRSSPAWRKSKPGNLQRVQLLRLVSNY